MTNHFRAAKLAFLLLCGLSSVFAGGTIVLAQDQTVPTRTPTPGPTDSAAATPTEDGNGSNPSPNPTSTDVPPGNATATATATTSISGATATATATFAPGQSSPTPTASTTTNGSQTAGSAIPGTCDPPIITVRELTLVHAGPGTDFPLVGSLAALDSRLIVGRAEFAPWWQILLIETEPQLLGWVADGNHIFTGSVDSVAIVEPPPLNGVTPTPGPLWQPTPIPAFCTPTATPSPTSTATPVATATVQSSATTTVTVAADTINAEGGGGSTIVVEGGSSSELTSQGSSIGKQLPEGNTAETGASSQPAESTAGSGIAPLLVPLLGAALIAGGIALGLLSRARPPAG